MKNYKNYHYQLIVTKKFLELLRLYTYNKQFKSGKRILKKKREGT